MAIKKIVFVESFKNGGLSDRPDLGAALLIANLRQSGFIVTNIGGQENYLPDMLSFDASFILSLVRKHFSEELYRNLDLMDFYIFSIGLGEEKFSKYLYSLKERVEKNMIDIKFLQELDYIFQSIMNLYAIEAKTGNYTFCFFDRLISSIKKANPQLICLSVMAHDILFQKFHERLQNEFKGIPIVLGGPLFSVLDREQIREYMEKLKISLLVVGEGEEALIKLAQGDDRKSIPNLVHCDKDKIIFNEEKQCHNLDNLAYPVFENIKFLYQYFRILPLQLGRGCTWGKCAFCSHHFVYRRNYRCFSSEWIIKTIKFYRQTYRIRHFVIHDDELPPGIVKKFCDALEENEITDCRFFSYARVADGYNNEQLLKHMFRVGFRVISWGVESGSQKILDEMRKGIKINEGGEILKKARAAGLKNICWFIAGFPGETKEDLKKTRDFIINNNPFISFLMISKFELLINTDLYKHAENYGVLPGEIRYYSPVVPYRLIKIAKKSENDNFLSLTNNPEIKKIVNKFHLPLSNISNMILFKIASERREKAHHNSDAEYKQTAA